MGTSTLSGSVSPVTRRGNGQRGRPGLEPRLNVPRRAIIRQRQAGKREPPPSRRTFPHRLGRRVQPIPLLDVVAAPRAVAVLIASVGLPSADIGQWSSATLLKMRSTVGPTQNTYTTSTIAATATAAPTHRAMSCRVIPVSMAGVYGPPQSLQRTTKVRNAMTRPAMTNNATRAHTTRRTHPSIRKPPLSRRTFPTV